MPFRKAMALLVVLALSRAGNATVPTAAPGRVLSVLARISATLRVSSYRHDARINEREGRYEFDCSSMAAWVLARSAPRALAIVSHLGSDRPVAVDFFHAIAAAAERNGRHGWSRVARISDAQAGDVLAWQRPRWFPSRNTGHVAFVLGPPHAMPGVGVLLRIADASSFNHENDTRAGRTGYGEGTILITTDPSSGEGTGYGWFGSQSGNWIVPTRVVVGRPVD